jgi:hypothetical protein
MFETFSIQVQAILFKKFEASQLCEKFPLAARWTAKHWN